MQRTPRRREESESVGSRFSATRIESTPIITNLAVGPHVHFNSRNLSEATCIGQLTT